MGRELISALLLWAAGGAAIAGDDAAYPREFTFAGNPLVRHVSSTDPDVHVWDGTVWMYCSQDHPKQAGDQGTYDHMDGYHAFSSSDLVHWTDHGEVMHSRDIEWGIEAGGWLWAPGAARRDGKYFLYYPHKDQSGTWRIGVATGDTPAGPFRDIGHPIEGITGIDPCIFIDDDGEAYLYNNSAVVARLKPNMIELAEPPRRIVYGPEDVMNDRVRKFLEGSYMHKRNGIYYYSYTNFRNGEYQGFYAMGSSPYGPFEWKGPMAPRPDSAQYHHSVIQFKGQWYDFYHVGGQSYKPEGYNGSRRIACFDALFYNEDGTIRMMEQTE